jgi:hypothetical protein
MIELMPLHGRPQVLAFAFGRKLGGVNADHDQFVRECVFEVPQLRDDVVAIDSAVGPKVENDDLAAEVGHRQRLGVEPLQPGRKLRRPNRPRILTCHKNDLRLGNKVWKATRGSINIVTLFCTHFSN